MLKQRVALRSRIPYKNILSVDFNFQKKVGKKPKTIGVVRAHKLASVILSGQRNGRRFTNRNKKRNVRRFINLQSGEGFT